MWKIIISGWKPGLDKIALTKIIRKHTGLSLSEGKLNTDKILEGKTIIFDNLNEGAAMQFLDDVININAIASITRRQP